LVSTIDEVIEFVFGIELAMPKFTYDISTEIPEESDATVSVGDM
jgi:hypothetical protein